MMPKNQFYRDKPCAYCGDVTGQGTGEHVIPHCLYPKQNLTPQQLQTSRLKVPACPRCNATFARDEPHFRSMVAASGHDPDNGRLEIMADASRSFRHPQYGRSELMSVIEYIVPMNVLGPTGMPVMQIYPIRSPRVRNIARKIVRGLCYHRFGEVIEDNRVFIDHFRDGDSRRFKDAPVVYYFPDVFIGRAIQMPAAFKDGRLFPLHSCWFIQCFAATFYGMVMAKGLTPADLDRFPLPQPSEPDWKSS
ncbi:MAG: hypothetical protein QM770_01095 [Tepidisphaeraceae bacterium]